MSNRRDIQFTFNPHNKATILDCSFTVTPTNASGITSLDQGGRIQNVFMHTSTTPTSGSPNPANGLIYVNLQDNYNKFLCARAQIVAPTSGTPISISGSSVLTVGQVYTITSMGTSTQANWHAVGVPSNITAAVGVSFIASVTGGGTGTGVVQAPTTAGSGVDHIELIGNPNLMNSNGAYLLGASQGMTLIFGCYGKAFGYDSGTPADSTVTNVLAAPATGSKIFLEMYFNNSAQGV